jgi:hypothetical protein
MLAARSIVTNILRRSETSLDKAARRSHRVGARCLADQLPGCDVVAAPLRAALELCTTVKSKSHCDLGCSLQNL